MSFPEEKRRLWVVSELYYPEETSTGYYLTRIAEGLADDFEVMALSGQPNYSARGTVAPKREERKGVRIFRVAGTRLDKNVIAYRLVNMLTLSTSIFWLAIRKFEKHDRVLVVTNPPAMPFVAAISCLFRGAGYTLLIHDNYPEILVAAGKFRQGSFLTKIMSVLNRWLYKHAEKIIVVGRDMRKLVQQKASGLDIPTVVIPNWAELETVEPLPRESNQLLGELGIVDKFVLLYAGNMGPPNDVESIIDAAEMLKDDGRYHFVFLGSGMKRPWLQNEIANLKLANVSVLDPRPRTEQRVFLNACDIALVSLVEKMRGVSVPSRTYNILAAGKPMIAVTESGSEVAIVVEEEGVGWIVPPGDPMRLVEAIRQASGPEAELAEKGQRARAAAVSKYSLETAIERYRDTLT